MMGKLSIDAPLLEHLFDQAADIVFFIKDDRGRYLIVNNTLVERNGLKSKQQLIGRLPSDVFPGVFGTRPTEQDVAVLRSGRSIINHLELHWNKTHKPCWCLTTKLPLRDGKGLVTGIIGFSRDLRAPLPLDEIPAAMTGALDYLDRHCAEPISPANLAKRSGLSGPRFARMVKRIFDLTPTQLIVKVRLATATRLLRETELSIGQIAIECGFYDHSAFTQTFRKATGMTPGEARRQ